MEVSSFVLLYFGTKIFVRCSEVSVVQRCPLMEVPLYFSMDLQFRLLTTHIRRCLECTNKVPTKAKGNIERP